MSSENKIDENESIIRFCHAVQQAHMTDNLIDWKVVFDLMGTGVFRKSNFTGLWKDQHDSMLGDAGLKLVQGYVLGRGFNPLHKRILFGFTSKKLELEKVP